MRSPCWRTWSTAAVKALNLRAARAGILVQVPHAFLKDAVAPLGFDLPVAEPTAWERRFPEG